MRRERVRSRVQASRYTRSVVPIDVITARSKRDRLLPGSTMAGSLAPARKAAMISPVSSEELLH